MISNPEEEMAFQLKLVGIPFEREFKFCPTRRWRSDFMIDQLLLEIEGGVHTNGRHVRGKGFENDCEKYNTATMLGFRLLRVTPKHVKSGEALKWIEETLKLLKLNDKFDIN